MNTRNETCKKSAAMLGLVWSVGKLHDIIKFTPY